MSLWWADEEHSEECNWRHPFVTLAIVRGGHRIINTRRRDVGGLREGEAERGLVDGGGMDGGMRGWWHCHLSVCSDPLLSSAAQCPN